MSQSRCSASARFCLFSQVIVVPRKLSSGMASTPRLVRVDALQANPMRLIMLISFSKVKNKV